MTDQVETAKRTRLERRDVVTAFLRRNGRILLVRRGGRVGSYRGRWSAISGYLEDPTPLAQAKREIREETGIPPDRVALIAAGGPIDVPAPERQTLWIVHPFLFELDDEAEVRLDWENTALDWVRPDELARRETVPKLAEAYRACEVAG